MDFTPLHAAGCMEWDPGREDTLASGLEFRTVNLEDDCTRECPALVDVCYRGAASL